MAETPPDSQRAIQKNGQTHARSRAGGDIWLVGHSLGGVCANTLFKAWPAEAPPAGLILLGSYVDESGAHSLVRYPAPVLMVNGELDGLTRVCPGCDAGVDFWAADGVKRKEYS